MIVKTDLIKSLEVLIHRKQQLLSKLSRLEFVLIKKMSFRKGLGVMIGKTLLGL